jgi:3-oxoacyl-[acyl-carrier-protein] synthase II
MNRVAVTGIGMIDTLGNNPKDCSSSFLSAEYIEPVPYEWCDLEEYRNQKVFPVTAEVELPDIHPKTVRTFDNNIKYAIHATNQALKDSGVSPSKNVAVLASNITAGDSIMYDEILNLDKNGRMKKIKNFLAGMKDFLPGFICRQWGFEGPNVALNGACATSLFSIDYGMRLVDEYDYVVCAASDAPINNITVPFFSNMGALGTTSDPFGETRDGFIPGDGGVCFILESEEKALARGARVHAWIYPVGFASDTTDPTSPDPDGNGAKNAMRKAMNNAGVNKDDIAFVNAHGTSTPIGDEIEMQAINEVFESQPIEVIACKKKNGHSMGACGMIEAIYGMAKVNKNNKKRYFLNNSFGFGGKCTSQIVEVTGE